MRASRRLGRRLTACATLVLGGLTVGAAAPEAARSQEVGLEDLAWLSGTWRGPGPEGAVAEIHFMEPDAGSLPSIFRLRQGDRVVVLEAISLVEEEDGLTMYVRHFDTALVPMEKEGAIALRMTERRGDAFHFENLNPNQNPRRSVMTRTDDGFTSVSFLARPDGSTDEIRVSYRRAGGD